MKSIVFVFVLALSISFLNAQTSGGPDAFGYIWKNSDDPQGPEFKWIDITGTGKLVLGVADDNAVGPFNLPFQFNYYDSTYSEIKIGSNGWVSLVNIGNMAHCFSQIPQAGGISNFIAPFTADLNFYSGGSPNYGLVYYDTLRADTFIVSYIDAPFWVNATPDFIGYNTFQVIFDAQDYSITFQYLQIEDTLATYSSGCSRNSVVGIENKDGSTGLEVYADTNLPPDSMAVKFTCDGCFSVGIDNPGNNIKIYPNPASGQIKIEAENMLYFELLDESGRIILIRNESVIDVSAFPDGLYFLRLITDKGVHTEKVIIQ